MSSKDLPQPWKPAKYAEDVVYALQALATGTANKGQQVTALQWIINDLAGTYDETYFADSERNTAYAQGKRHVGLQMVKLIKLSPAALNWNDVKEAVKPKTTKAKG